MGAKKNETQHCLQETSHLTGYLLLWINRFRAYGTNSLWGLEEKMHLAQSLGHDSCSKMLAIIIIMDRKFWNLISEIIFDVTFISEALFLIS